MDTSFSSPERSLRAAEGSFFTFQCLPPWWAITGNPTVALNSWLLPCANLCSTFVLTRSLTRAQTSCSRWPPGTGMSPKSWPTVTGGTSCETFSCTFPETAETGCLWLWRWHSDVLQILFKHRGRPQAPTLVQVEFLLQLKVPFSFTLTKVAVSPPTHTHSADTIPPFNRCCLSCEFNCGYVDVSFSHNMQHFLLYCKGERRPASAPPGRGTVLRSNDLQLTLLCHLIPKWR